MSRVVAILLLIANLLVCPLRCAGAGAAAKSTDDGGSAGCHCCAKKVCEATGDADRSESVKPPYAPEALKADSPKGQHQLPAEDCACPSCICEGAMPSSPAEIQGVQHSALLVTCCADSAAVSAAKVVSRMDQPPPPRPPREKLSLQQSWLI
ncbi:MAG: hypothetical protein Fues2KO_25520 [Fuerstiella sp.]